MVNDLPHGAALRKGRYSALGQIYLITAVTYNRAPLLENFQMAQCAIYALRSTTVVERVDTLAYVLMPDHLHWLFQLKEGDLSRVVQRVKSKSAFEINRYQGANGQIWQRGFHDRALRKEDDVKKVARYIVANPLRAGLVESIGDYPFWDAIWL